MSEAGNHHASQATERSVASYRPCGTRTHDGRHHGDCKPLDSVDPEFEDAQDAKDYVERRDIASGPELEGWSKLCQIVRALGGIRTL